MHGWKSTQRSEQACVHMLIHERKLGLGVIRTGKHLILPSTGRMATLHPQNDSNLDHMQYTLHYARVPFKSPSRYQIFKETNELLLRDSSSKNKWGQIIPPEALVVPKGGGGAFLLLLLLLLVTGHMILLCALTADTWDEWKTLQIGPLRVIRIRGGAGRGTF